MSLPAGFGGNTDTCSTCGSRFTWDQRTKNYLCDGRCVVRSSPERRNGELPISKHQLGLYIWFGSFGLCLLLSIGIMFMSIGVGLIMFIIVAVMGHILAQMAFGIGFRHSTYTSDEIFPWLVPVKNIIGEYHFKETDER